VAANLESTTEDLDINGPLLAPGFGVQGGSGEHLVRIFADVSRLVLPSTSRDVLAAGPSVSGLQRAAARAASEVESALGSTRV
jgi:orotidine-5'-phosphate decarboxylase